MPLFVPKSAAVVLTEEQLKNIFIRHDINGDGKLDRAELRKAFKDLGAIIPPWRAHRALHHADADGNGCIDENELNELVKYAAKFGYALK